MDQAPEIARTILLGFDRHYRIFREASAVARRRFERKEWKELRETARARIDLYDLRVLECVDSVTHGFPIAHDEKIWPSVKRAYIALLYDHKQPECAETFFNSVAAKVLNRQYHDNQYIFRKPAVAAEHIESNQPTYRCYYPAQDGLRRTLLRIFSDFGLALPLESPRRCVRNLLGAFGGFLPPSVKLEPNFHVQVLSSLFYRGKGAYAVGRVINGRHRDLFAISLRHSSTSGLRVDALIHEREHLANLFSVANAYFMVDMEVPSSWISFIHTALPEKPKAELYTAVGLQKQGKTLFFRDLYQHLQHSADRFVIAPGVRGMVMFVFTLPSFPFVFKVIRDRFAPPKDTSKELVIGKYRLVKHHDRVGRLADTLEFTDVAFPLSRFHPELLEEMKQMIPSSIEIDGDLVVIRHMYIEQRMTPLDMYLDEASAAGDRARQAHGIGEFGQALRDLAAANIFPGDLLPKNFGVSPYGRVLFYDYDEVCYLTECRFREIPAARYDEDEMRAEPWYSVGPNDVFPEEFPTFLFSDEGARRLFTEVHGDLLKPGFWIRTQENIKTGVETDLYPYPLSIRFPD
jgi:isocitrate dehydrogenase kinase/phosphatase